MRRSLDSRMDRIVDRLLPPGSMVRREHYLPEDLRAALHHHRSKTRRIISRYEKREQGSWYAAFLASDPDAQVPAMPLALRVALGLSDPPQISAEMSADEASAIYLTMIGDQ